MPLQLVEESESFLLREIGFERTHALVVVRAYGTELRVESGQAHVEILRPLIQFNDLNLPAEKCGNDKLRLGRLARLVEKREETGVVPVVQTEHVAVAHLVGLGLSPVVARILLLIVHHPVKF